MSYRTEQPKERYPKIFANAKKCDIHMDNGTILHVAIPCFYHYLEGHSRPGHDYVGWPTPDQPDKSCQSPYRDRRFTTVPIDLIKEGYSVVYVRFANPVAGIFTTTEIDGNIIRISFDISVNTTEDSEYPFFIYIEGTEGSDLRSLVTKGTLYVSAGMIS